MSIPRMATPSRRLLEELRAATLESGLEELGVFRTFTRPRVANRIPYYESLFRFVKYRPDYPRKPFVCKEQACQWDATFLDGYNHRNRHSGIKVVTPTSAIAPKPLKSAKAGRGLRPGPSTSSPSVGPIHPLLATTSGGVDQ